MEANGLGLAPHRRSAIEDHHVYDLPRRQREVLLLEAFGLELSEIAGVFGTSHQTVKNQASTARATVVPPPLPTTRANATWTILHRSCCMATASVILSGSFPAAKSQKDTG